MSVNALVWVPRRVPIAGVSESESALRPRPNRRQFGGGLWERIAFARRGFSTRQLTIVEPDERSSDCAGFAGASN